MLSAYTHNQSLSKRDLPFMMQLSSFMWFGVGSAIRNTQGHLDTLTAGVTDQTTVLQISGLPLCISILYTLFKQTKKY